MLNLSKYEFRKNRNLLIIIILGLVLLEAYFMISCRLQNQDHTTMSMAFLMLYGMFCFFIVFFLAVDNYSKELSSKSSYLIFMTPNSSLKIILSKILTIFVTGMLLLCLLVGFAVMDYYIFTNAFPKAMEYQNFFEFLLNSFHITLPQFVAFCFMQLIGFVVDFFSAVTLIYLAITLSSTLLQNNKFKWILSIAIFFLFAFIYGKISELLPASAIHSISGDLSSGGIDIAIELFMQSIPQFILALVTTIGSIFGSAVLLDKKVSL